MRIRMKIAVSGMFHGRANGVAPGDIVDVEDGAGARYCAHHYAEPVVDRKEEHAVAPKAEERAEPEPSYGTAPPRSGKGSGVDAWSDYAYTNNVDVPDDAGRDDIITACEAAGVPVD